MAENETENGAAAQPEQPQQQPMKMNVLAQYVRDLSFENILSQKGASGEVQPDMEVQVNLDAKKRQQPNQYEVVLKLKVTSKSKATGDVLFLMEMDYAGVFLIENIPDEQLHPFLLIECPRMIFPFARRIVSDVTRDGGFPPLNLETIDFVALYRNEIMRRQAQQAAEKPDA
ncbi:MAG: protein-export chaperone SecB [Rhodobacteraceae bacterium]|nr:MAG: protein-export chaperone SecB [Paracoccaceae bacterium]